MGTSQATHADRGWTGRQLAHWLGVVVAVGLLLSTYRWLEIVANGQKQTFLIPLVNEMTGALAGGVVFFAVLALVRRLPLDRRSWPVRFPLYLAAAAALGGVSTTLMWGQREAAYRLLGLGDYDYGIMPVRYLMELPMQLIVFTIMVGAIHAADAARAARERQLAAARLETSLARAQLEGLRRTLDPHFLFNALNTVSSTMYDDPCAADQMLASLAELLRASLATGRADEILLGDELALLRHYLDLLDARFGDRLQVEVKVASGCDDLQVPPLLLQPLVENAVRHGGLERSGRAAIRVAVERHDRVLRAMVEDDGPGIAPGADACASGVGLSATAERLRLLYGEAGRVEAGNRPGGGFRVTVELPAKAAGEER